MQLVDTAEKNVSALSSIPKTYQSAFTKSGINGKSVNSGTL